MHGTPIKALSAPPLLKESVEISELDEHTVVIQPRKNLFALDLKAIWEYKELLYFLVWRDLKVRYRQSIIGIGWVILQPLATMVIFTALLAKLLRSPPMACHILFLSFQLCCLWTLFASSLNRASLSVAGNAQLVSKIYFPRLLLPLSGILSPVVDFAIAFVILIGMMIWFGLLPTWGVLALPLFLLVAILAALAMGLWLSALNVRYRDVSHAIPFLTQVWMFATPVAYPVSLVPEKWRLLYSLNPMAGVIEGFRWALLGNESPDFGVIAVSTFMVFALMVPGLVYFRYTERTFADVI